VKLTRELYHVHPDPYRNDIATLLDSYGTSLGYPWVIRRTRDAEAVELMRKLYLVDLEQYRNDLARNGNDNGFNTTAAISANMGCERACDVDTEGMEPTRERYRCHPAQYRDVLARRLQNYGDSLHPRGLSEAASNAMAETQVRTTCLDAIARLHTTIDVNTQDDAIACSA
jgi:hypothetical protein